MSFSRKCLALTYTPLRACKFIADAIGLGQARIRVLMFHDLAYDDISDFKRLLLWLENNWHFLSPHEFEEVMIGNRKITRDSLLLTFDDGFYSNYTLAREVLRPLGVSAVFFVVPDFVSMQSTDEVNRFISKRLLIERGVREIPSHPLKMGWNDLADLVDDGHLVGAHSMSHERLGPGLDPEILRQEIVLPAREIEKRLSIPVRHFAFPFGTIDSLSKDAVDLAGANYSFVYSGIRGFNFPGSCGRVFRRDCIGPKDHLKLVGSFLLGGADVLYRAHNQHIDSWASS